MLEIEVKIRVDDLGLIKEKIIGQGAHLLRGRSLEENTLYDFPTGELFRKKQAIRLRKLGKKASLTFKGTPQKSKKFKVRDEYETEVKNRKQIHKILKSLGLKPVFTYKKYRTVYRLGRLNICLDETAVGHFIELEGERNKIMSLVRKLGFTKKELIKLDYVALLAQQDIRERNL